MLNGQSILAREGDTGLPEEDFVVNELVREEIEPIHPLNPTIKGVSHITLVVSND